MTVPPVPPIPIMRCPHCGTANRAGSNFCNGCGTDLRESQMLSDLASAQVAPPDDAADLPADQPAPRAPTPPPAATSSSAPPTSARPQSQPGAQPGASSSSSLPSSPLPDASPTPDAFADQPWLHLEFVPDDEASHDVDLESEANTDDHGRLVTAIQGLLTPIRVATNITDETPLPPKRNVLTVDELSNDELRMIRGLMSEQPALVGYQVRPALAPPRPLRIGWIFALVGLAVALPAFFLLGGPVGVPHRWPGVEEAYLTIQGVAPDSLVVVYWAYDPATSGEINLAMQPVMRHLLQRRARLAIITTTPGGIGTAERLIAQVRAAEGTGDLALAADLAQPITFAYLPGGAASLPLVARDPARALLENIMVAAPDLRETLMPRPALVVATADAAEDVQQWLEQVQALDPVPVIGVTAAGADPVLRPYLASGQLSGLVSGFDGAYAYRQLLDPFIVPEINVTLLQQIILQNWGHFALLAVIALGNLAALLGREGGA